MTTGQEEGLTVEQVVELVRLDALRWAVENGVKGSLVGVLRVTDFGFEIEVDSDAGKSALCTYLRDGARSMYQLTRGR